MLLRRPWLANASGLWRRDCMRTSGGCTLSIVMSVESSRYLPRDNCGVTAYRNPVFSFDRRALAKRKVGARVRLPEQILRIKEGYE
jgi:hypothetical protein